MDDMTRLEQRMADDAQRVAGPSHPVDAAAILTSITATRSPKLRFQSMFSAAKFVVAGAIVALFGGLLLVAQPFDQQGASVPGASFDDGSMTPAIVTGREYLEQEQEQNIAYTEHEGFARSVDVSTSRIEMSDPRLTGVFTTEVTTDIFAGTEHPHITLAWDSTRIENEAGAWEGTGLGSDVIEGNGLGYVELVGSGAYEGLSALLFQWQTSPGPGGPPTQQWSGVIVPGDLPPDR